MKPSLAGRMTTLLEKLGVNIGDEVENNLQIIKMLNIIIFSHSKAYYLSVVFQQFSILHTLRP